MTDPITRRRAAIALCGGGLAVALGGCVTTPAPRGPAPTAVDVTLVADDGVNPDQTGQAAPVRVTVYWLRQAAAFQTADYFALADDAATVLGDDLAGQETLTMRPRSSQTLTASPPPGVGFLGVVAAYRDLNNVSWRGVASLAPNRRNVLEVRLGRFGVTIGQGGLTAQRPAPVAAR